MNTRDKYFKRQQESIPKIKTEITQKQFFNDTETHLNYSKKIVG